MGSNVSNNFNICFQKCAIKGKYYEGNVHIYTFQNTLFYKITIFWKLFHAT